ncbi:MAG: FAD-dependent oxidoreductase [bacterium]
MLKLKINGTDITVEPGTTVLEAAQAAGILIPSLCYLKGVPHFTSCMICVVQDQTSGRLIPACSALATESMVIETDTPAVRQARISSLNLLMSEHAGECEAPCTTTCPAHLNIPLMIRQIAAGNLDDALATLYGAIALPAVLGRICPAPCENACRRGRLDAPLSICLLERFAADTALAEQRPPESTPMEGAALSAPAHRVAIVGSGPAGLATAFHLARSGYACTVFDEHAEAGGQLRYGVSRETLPASVLDREIERIQRTGVTFRLNTRIGLTITLQDLKSGFDAIVLAIGKTPADSLAAWGVETHSRGIKVNEHSLQTSDERIFAGGEAIQPGPLAVRAVAHGKRLAVAIDQFLRGLRVTGPGRRFESRLGKITENESRELLKDASPAARRTPGAGSGFSQEEAIRESGRCMHCDCRKAEGCKLRDTMEFYMTGPMHIPAEGRTPLARNITHPRVIFEPGKCIKCGICIRLTTRAGERPGLTFLNRGFDAVVGAPFGESLEAALGQSASHCVTTCPTGALAWKNTPTFIS